MPTTSMTQFAFLAAFMACVPIANWLIGNVGTTCVPNGPCLVPVGFGLTAPSGVAIIGLALVLRDVIQRQYGLAWAVAAVAAGTAASAIIAPPAIVLAAAASYAVCELADTAVYTPLRQRGLVLAVLASGVVGLVVDSVLFLWLAFGSLDYLPGQIVGKVWGTVIGLAVLRALDRRREALA